MNSVLLVDDSGLFREVGEAIRRRTSCRLLTASSGSEALALARQEKPDVIFLDSELSGMSGIDVCRVLKADPRIARTPIVLVTDEDGTDVRRVPVDALLPRSFDDATFFGTLRRFLQLFPRNTERSSVGWQVTFWRDGAEHAGSIRDLSRGGFFVNTPVRLPIGARLEVSFEIPGERADRAVVAEAIVVRVGQEPQRGLGCRFFRLTQGSRAYLEDCLRLLSLAETPEAADTRQFVASRPFADVPASHPFFRAIEALAASGITSGCGAGNFCPDQPVSRGEIAKFLANALGLHFAN